jgi:hypothetical protein
MTAGTKHSWVLPGGSPNPVISEEAWYSLENSAKKDILFCCGYVYYAGVEHVGGYATWKFGAGAEGTMFEC